MRLAIRSSVLLVVLILSLIGQPAPFNAITARALEVALNIVYPGEGDKLPYVRQSFIFGSTQPGSAVSVNGSSALVASSGGWIAYVPVSPGDFRFHVVSRLAGSSTAADRTVAVAYPLRTLPPSPARIDPSVPAQPAENMTLRSGDVVRLFVKASTQARVVAAVDGASADVPLVETKAPSLNPSDKERVLGDAAAGGELVGGEYQGEFRIPMTPATNALVVRYTVTAADGSMATATAKGTITVNSPASFRVGYVVLADRKKDIDARPYGVVESEPDGGWLFFPPEHTPFEVTGSAGEYYRVVLGTNEQAWISRQSLALAPLGTPRPRAFMQGIVISDGPRAGIVTIHLNGRVPFSVSETVDGPRLQVRLYGADAATEFVRYGHDRSNVAEVRWDQLPGDIAEASIKLRQHALWGYRARWDGNDLELTVKKPPHFQPAPASALKGLLIVIDPGHSPDSGSIGPLGTQERDVNLQIAERLAVHLGRLGARTVLTRTANVPVGLYDRTDLATRLGADVLISVHNNALPDGINPFTHHGFSVYYYQPQSLALARAIHEAYGSDTNLPDYGLYYDNLALVRPTEEPAVLTESAFIMWPPEETDLRSPAFQENLAATLTDGLNSWARVMRAYESVKH